MSYLTSLYLKGNAYKILLMRTYNQYIANIMQKSFTVNKNKNLVPISNQFNSIYSLIKSFNE